MVEIFSQYGAIDRMACRVKRDKIKLAFVRQSLTPKIILAMKDFAIQQGFSISEVHMDAGNMFTAHIEDFYENDLKDENKLKEEITKKDPLSTPDEITLVEKSKISNQVLFHFKDVNKRNSFISKRYIQLGKRKYVVKEKVQVNEDTFFAIHSGPWDSRSNTVVVRNVIKELFEIEGLIILPEKTQHGTASGFYKILVPSQENYIKLLKSTVKAKKTTKFIEWNHTTRVKKFNKSNGRKK